MASKSGAWRSRSVLIQTYRNALSHSALRRSVAPEAALADLQALGLTRRQAEVLSLVAMVHSNEAAAALGIGVRTAQKHLERCYRTLGVSNRSQASQLAWGRLTAPPSPLVREATAW